MNSWKFILWKNRSFHFAKFDSYEKENSFTHNRIRLINHPKNIANIIELSICHSYLLEKTNFFKNKHSRKPISYIPWNLIDKVFFANVSHFKLHYSDFNPFVSNSPFLCSLKTSQNRKVFWCFQGVETGCIGNVWVKNCLELPRRLTRRETQVYLKELTGIIWNVIQIK